MYDYRHHYHSPGCCHTPVAHPCKKEHHTIRVCRFDQRDGAFILKSDGPCRKFSMCNGDRLTVKLEECIPAFGCIMPVYLEFEGKCYPLLTREGNFFANDQLRDRAVYRFVYGNHPEHLLCVDCLPHSSADNCGHYTHCTCEEFEG